MSVVNVKTIFIRPQYANLREWCNDPNNVYVGRGGVVFIDGFRYPPAHSPFANPYKIGRDGDRNEVLMKYRAWLEGKMADPIFAEKVRGLRGKTLGCWCKLSNGVDVPCHGDILLEFAGRD